MKALAVAVAATLFAYALGTWLQGQLAIAAAIVASAGR